MQFPIIWLSIAMLTVLTLTPQAQAKPLDSAQVPNDAKWVVHVDFDAFHETMLVKRIEKAKPELVAGIREWMSNKYGVDPKSDLHGLTMFGQSYETHTGTAILAANFDQEKVVNKLKDTPQLKTTQWKGHTLYTKKEKNSQTVTILPLNGTHAIFASSPEKVQQAVKLIQGEEDSLKNQTSPLVREVPLGSVLYGAAIDLQQIERHDGVFPILRQHEQITYALGNDGEHVFEELELVAASDKVAEEMKAVIDGFTAFLKVWSAENKALERLSTDLTITKEGRKVTSYYHGTVQDVSAAFDAVSERWKRWKRLATRE